MISNISYANVIINIIPKIGLDFNIGSINNKTYYNTTNPRTDINIQVGYNFKPQTTNDSIYRGIDLLVDLGINTSMITGKYEDNQNINEVYDTGFYTGLALKVILGNDDYNSKIGLASGIKISPIIYKALNLKQIPYSPYIRLSFENVFYANNSIKAVSGVEFLYEYFIYDNRDKYLIFNNNINNYQNISIMYTIGIAFDISKK